MTLFKFGEKKDEATSAEGVSSEKNKGIENIKVLGTGCRSCHEQYENAKDAIKNTGIKAEVEYITDMEKIVNYGVMSTPAIVINDKVVSSGKVLKTKDVEKLLNSIR